MSGARVGVELPGPDGPAAPRFPYGEADERPHRGRERDFNDSVYLNFVDPHTGLGGMLRLGLRPGLGYNEFTVSLPLPDGRLFFSHGRATEPHGLVHRGGGLSFEVIEPYRAMRVRFEGRGSVLRDPAQLVLDTRAALDPADAVPCSLELGWRARHPAHLQLPSGAMVDDAVLPFAADHYEQFGVADGEIRLAGRRLTVAAAPSCRDHSWGPRHWVGPRLWNISLISMDDGTCLSVSETLDTRRVVSGALILPDGTVHALRDAAYTVVYDGGPTMPQSFSVMADAGRGGPPLTADADNLAFIPLRHRLGREPNGGVLRIGQAMSRFRGADGTAGWGWTDLWRRIKHEYRTGEPSQTQGASL